jgi:hypothetical protein
MDFSPDLTLEEVLNRVSNSDTSGGGVVVRHEVDGATQRAWLTVSADLSPNPTGVPIVFLGMTVRLVAAHLTATSRVEADSDAAARNVVIEITGRFELTIDVALITISYGFSFAAELNGVTNFSVFPTPANRMDDDSLVEELGPDVSMHDLPSRSGKVRDLSEQEIVEPAVNLVRAVIAGRDPGPTIEEVVTLKTQSGARDSNWTRRAIVDQGTRDIEPHDEATATEDKKQTVTQHELPSADQFLHFLGRLLERAEENPVRVHPSDTTSGI